MSVKKKNALGFSNYSKTYLIQHLWMKSLVLPVCPLHSSPERCPAVRC